MRGVAMKTILAAVAVGMGLLVAAEANAHDRWDRSDRWERKHHHKHSHWRDDPPRRVVVERPVFVERARPVMMAPMAPAYPAYGPPVDPSVNFNFSFPMR